jgi:hypothetical protein
MSKAKGKPNLKMIKRRKDHKVTLREATKDSPIGWNTDLGTKIEFLMRQIDLELITEVKRQIKQSDPEPLEKSSERLSKLRMKVRNLFDLMYPNEVIKKEIEKQLSILGEISAECPNCHKKLPNLRDKLVRKMKKEKNIFFSD